MAFTRLTRTDTVANLVDFGAIPNNPGVAATNAMAFRSAFNAFGTGPKRVVIPAGTWYFEQILYQGNPWIPRQTEIFGQGSEQTILRYVPTNDAVPAFRFAPGSMPDVSRSSIHSLQLIGRVAPSLGVPPVGIGIQFLTTQLNCVHDVQLWYFDVAIDFQPGFSGYTAIERFEIYGSRTAIRMRDGSNGVLVQSGRINGAITQVGTGVPPTSPPYTAESGIGIDIEGTAGTAGPAGGTGIVISAVQIETAPVCLRIVRSRDIAVVGCYLEPGNRPTPNTITGARRTLELDAESERIALVGTLQSEPTVTDPADPIPTQDWTPNYVARAPEARGLTDVDAFHGSGTTFTNNAYGAGQSGATAPHANHLRNADMSRGGLFWTRQGLPPGNVVEVTTAADYIIGGRSLQLTSTAVSGDHIWQDFTVDAGVRSITATFRYRAIPAATAAFRLELATVTGPSGMETITPLGFYSDTDAVTTAWRVRYLTARFDGTLTGLQGPRRFRVRAFPYNVDGPGTAGRQVIVDSMWIVDGEYAAPYRPYQEGVEVLSGDDRLVLFGGVNAAAPAGPSGIPASARVPSNAVGMVTEMSVLGTQATATTTTLTVDDGTGTDDTRVLHAFVNNRPTVVEYTVPLQPGGANVQWSMAGASGANLVTYSVRLKAWVYRL